MAKLTHSAALLVGIASSSFILEGSALAQSATAPASAAFPPAAAEPAPASPPPTAAPAPRTLPTPPSPPPEPAPVAAPATPPPAYPPPPQYTDTYPRETRVREVYPGGDPPPPPPEKPDEGVQRPEISVRIDPFNLLLEGRLGLEIETQLYQFLTLELVPVLVTTQSPPTLNYDTYRKSTVHQASNGIGALSGAAIDAGFWLGGKPFRGYVLRVGITNYAYTYDATDKAGTIDSVSHTDREFFVMFGQHSRWGAFTIAGAIGLGYELNKQNRCFNDLTGAPQGNCDKDQQLLRLDRSSNPDLLNLHGVLYPFDLMARFSLGVVF